MPLEDLLTEPLQYGSGYPASENRVDRPRYVRITDIPEEGGLSGDGASVPLEGNESYLLEPGDVLFARSGATVGKTYLHKEEARPHIFAGYLIRARVDTNKILPEFLYVFTRSSRYREWIARTARSGAQPNISASEYGRLLVPLPALDAQTEIVHCWRALDAYDQTVAASKDERERFQRGLMQQLLTGKRRFPGFAQAPWHEVRLGEVFDERDETGRSDLPLLAITGRRGVVSRDELVRRDSSAEDKSRYKRIAPGDIGYNTMRMWQGVSGFSRLEGIVSPAYTVVVPRRDRILSEFAAHLFKAPPIIHRFRRFSQGLVDDTLSLKYPIFAQVRVLLPSLAEQACITQVLDVVVAEIDVLDRLKKELTIQKHALIDRLLDGADDR